MTPGRQEIAGFISLIAEDLAQLTKKLRNAESLTPEEQARMGLHFKVIENLGPLLLGDDTEGD